MIAISEAGITTPIVEMKKTRYEVTPYKFLGGAKTSVLALATPASLPTQSASCPRTPPHPPIPHFRILLRPPRVLPVSSTASRSRELWGGKSALRESAGAVLGHGHNRFKRQHALISCVTTDHYAAVIPLAEA